MAVVLLSEPHKVHSGLNCIVLKTDSITVGRKCINCVHSTCSFSSQNT